MKIDVGTYYQFGLSYEQLVAGLRGDYLADEECLSTNGYSSLFGRMLRVQDGDYLVLTLRASGPQGNLYPEDFTNHWHDITWDIWTICVEYVSARQAREFVRLADYRDHDLARTLGLE